MTDHLSIIETALTIRPRLSELLGVEAGEKMRQQLDQFLQQVQTGESVEDVIWDLLTDTKATRTWATQFQQTTQKGLNQPPGQISAITVPQFKCPLCDHSWSRQRSNLLTPFCPIHNVLLEPV